MTYFVSGLPLKGACVRWIGSHCMAHAVPGSDHPSEGRGRYNDTDFSVLYLPNVYPPFYSTMTWYFFLLSFRKKYDSKSHVLRSDFIESEGETTRLPVTVIILLARKNAAGKGGVCHTFLLVECSRLVVSKTWHHHRQPTADRAETATRRGLPTRRALTDAPERNPTSNYCPTITLPIDDL